MRPLAPLSLLSLLSMFAGSVGCASRTAMPPMAPAPFSADRLEALRASYKRAFPNARIGLVTAVLPDRPYALVGQIDTAGIRVGSIVTIVDANETVITNGRVELIDANGLTIRFDEGKRRPMEADAAIKF